jgi:hypothetical protein
MTREEHDSAERYLQLALDAAESASNRFCQAEALCRLAVLARQDGDVVAARSLCQKVFEIASEDPDHADWFVESRAICAHVLGSLAWDEDDTDRAGRWLEEAADSYERAGDVAAAQNVRQALKSMTEEEEKDDEHL